MALQEHQQNTKDKRLQKSSQDVYLFPDIKNHQLCYKHEQTSHTRVKTRPVRFQSQNISRESRSPQKTFLYAQRRLVWIINGILVVSEEQRLTHRKQKSGFNSVILESFSCFNGMNGCCRASRKIELRFSAEGHKGWRQPEE